MSADRATALRGLPSVDQLLRRLAERPELGAVPRARLTALVREVLDVERKRVLDGRGASGVRLDKQQRRIQGGKV